MSDATEYTIGAQVTCNDGDCGGLTRVVIDPVARAVTHLVVEPRHHLDAARLVPIELVESTVDGIRLNCSAREFGALEDAEETHFLMEPDDQMGYAEGEAMAWPYYGLGTGMGVGGIGGMGMGGMGMGMGVGGPPPVITYERLPVGEVDIRRGDHVHATDGNIGRIHGLVIDPKDHHVSHVLLEEGHLWGKKELAIPIDAVAEVAADGVRLSLSKSEVRDLPPVDLSSPR